MAKRKKRPTRTRSVQGPTLPHGRAEEIYHSEDLWVLNKPAGVLSHPNPPARSDRAAVLPLPYDRNLEAFLLDQDGKTRRIYLIHRLDQDTSGVLLLSFDAELAAQIKELFFHHEIDKEYHALVAGIVQPATGVWTDCLRKQRLRGQVKVTATRGSPNAVTRYRVLKTFAEQRLSLLSLRPETGRTHQLRVQAASRRHPIAGDERYGDFGWNKELRRDLGLRRMYLHAARVEFRHPRTGRRLRFLAEAGKSLDQPLGNIVD
jgi:RluA family pseudouridine synthase